MSIKTEQEVINKFFPDDNTKTIEDVVSILMFTDVPEAAKTREKAISSMKGIDVFANVTDWSV